VRSRALHEGERPARGEGGGDAVKLPGQPPILAEPKADAGRRVLRAGAQALAALRARRAAQDAERAALGDDYGGAWRDADLVFTTHTGTPLLPRNVDRHFKRALARAGLPLTIRFYDLRHGNATAMLAAGVPARVAAKRLGHASTAMSHDRYAHLLAELDEDAAARVEQAINGGPGGPAATRSPQRAATGGR
jgi:integrase